MSSTVTVQQVKTQDEMRMVYQLTHDTFVEKNLIHEQENRLLINNRALDLHEDTQVFIAWVNGKIRGTISISIHQKIEEVYNYPYFADLLIDHYDPNAPSFSGWRLATQGNPIERYLISISLIMHGSNIGFNLGIPQAYFSFIPTQLKAYKRLFPSGEILGVVKKKTDIIDSKLVLMKYAPSLDGYQHLSHLYNELDKRYQRKRS